MTAEAADSAAWVFTALKRSGIGSGGPIRRPVAGQNPGISKGLQAKHLSHREIFQAFLDPFCGSSSPAESSRETGNYRHRR